jgi:hypothetical protein
LIAINISTKGDGESNTTVIQEADGEGAQIDGFNRKLTQLKNLDQLLPMENKFWNLALDIGPEFVDIMTASSFEFYQSCMYEGAPCNVAQHVYFICCTIYDILNLNYINRLWMRPTAVLLSFSLSFQLSINFGQCIAFNSHARYGADQVPVKARLEGEQGGKLKLMVHARICIYIFLLLLTYLML